MTAGGRAPRICADCAACMPPPGFPQLLVVSDDDGKTTGAESRFEMSRPIGRHLVGAWRVECRRQHTTGGRTAQRLCDRYRHIGARPAQRSAAAVPATPNRARSDNPATAERATPASKPWIEKTILPVVVSFAHRKPLPEDDLPAMTRPEGRGLKPKGPFRGSFGVAPGRKPCAGRAACGARGEHVRDSPLIGEIVEIFLFQAGNRDLRICGA